ncbi:MAG: hypothetical protein KC502_09635 [Myxococcales bacterium]|nr:hypothetical protein [Myxococcales bacterium]
MGTARRASVPHLCGWLVAVALTAGCDTKADVDLDAARAPAACLTVPVFGNGAVCEDTVKARDLCGTADDRICAAGWLCFDDVRSAFCTCSVDADCNRRANYINAARALRKMAPISAKCVAGRCAGLP